MDRIRNWKKYYIDYDRRAWIVLGLILLMATVSMVYNDFMITVRQGIVVWDALFDGRILDYYSYSDIDMQGRIWTSGIRTGSSLALYQFSTYAIFAIWDFPMWLFEHFTGLNSLDYFGWIFYAKLMLFVFLVVSAQYVVLIGRELWGENRERDNLLLLTYFSAVLLINNTMLTGCYDICGITFMLAGVYYYLKGDYTKFLLIFTVAINLKYIPVLVFVPLVLIHQKKIWMVLRDGAIGVSLTVILKILFGFGDMGEVGEVNDQVVDLSGSILDTGFRIGGFFIPLFGIIFLLFCLIVWIFISEKNAQWKRLALWVSIVPYALLFAMEKPHPQWITYAVPFATILLLGQRAKIKANLVVSGIFVTTQMVMDMLFYHWVYSVDNFVSMLWYVLLGKRASDLRNVDYLGWSVPEMLKRLQDYFNYAPLVEAIRIISMFLLLYFVFPIGDGKKLPFISPEKQKYEGVTQEDAVALRVHRLWMYMLILIPCVTYIGEMILYNLR